MCVDVVVVVVVVVDTYSSSVSDMLTADFTPEGENKDPLR